MRFRRRRSRRQPRLPDFAKDFFFRIELFVAILVLREAQRLLAPERQDAEHDEAVVEQRVDAVLQLAVEIDEHVPAEHDMELAERAVGDEVVLREYRVSRERR